jgi:two-component system chemotaxis response regulator CheY
MVIDDDPISRSVLIEVVDSFPGIEVCEMESGEAAWQLLSGGLHPVLVCCDVHMGGMSGIDLFRRMRSEPRMSRIPVLMVTSASDRETVTEALKLGAAGFIIKPFKSADARSKIEAALNKAVDRLFEDSGVASKRMGVAPTRYATYLESLAGQIDSALMKVGAGAALDKPLLKVLHTGSLTLGAVYCTAVIDAAEKSLANGPLSAEIITGISDLVPMLRERSMQVREKIK